ncbi:hypothetical protein [Streptomyces halobius]|uniref:Molecular chaperone DnaJ n=1 Tax=Streptomyces halobius TaxID=2879846 RepID=A0ABY4MC65_9ACTN|nr:hypothetical protein [Streptomyces halobius]UQA94379.1 hypothetical protein K9S39_23200 [Streptomyces halobius]
MNDRKNTPEPADTMCHWCGGTGYVTRALAYSSGVDPFHGPAETVHRAAECKHCRGSGVYDARRDPTLERWRDTGPPPSRPDDSS